MEKTATRGYPPPNNMSQFLPPYLLALFSARDPPPYLPPTDKLTHEKKRQPYTGLAEYLDQFEDPEETPPPVKVETKQERLERKRREKAEQNAYKLEQDLALWNPNSNTNATSNAYKTLFVARINYDTSESKLRREFETYGKIKQIKLVHDKRTDKPRGYAFIEYEEESAMHAAYKKADGTKIAGRRVLVDVERGRTIKGWKPRRLGGGKGGRKSHFDPMADRPMNIDDGGMSLDESKYSSTRRGGAGEYAERERDSSRGRVRDRERRRSRDKSKSKTKSRSRSREKERERDRKKRSKSRDRHRSRSKDRVKKSRRSEQTAKIPIKV